MIKLILRADISLIPVSCVVLLSACPVAKPVSNAYCCEFHLAVLIAVIREVWKWSHGIKHGMSWALSAV